MKKLIFVLLFVLIISVALLGQAPVRSEKLGNVKTVKSALGEETKVEIRKPDNSSIMPRKDTNLETDMKLSVIDKFKKSNKLLY
ncbi:MAG: hypothetical protein PF570_07585 [Candidatus Cloacimonetes bacterium]|jgi:hypothetical protein|nr:hypothetical protein [Candidatus Cloacimonadota bacterium]